MTNRTLAFALLVCSTLFSGCIVGYLPPKTTYKDEFVEVFKRDPFALPHFADERHYAKIGNVRFHDVKINYGGKIKGGKPCYVWLEKGKKLLLITQHYTDSYTGVWVVSFDTGIVQSGVVPSKSFGDCIGGYSMDRGEDEVVSFSDNSLVLRSTRSGRMGDPQITDWVVKLKFYAYLRKNDNGAFAL